MDEIIKIIAKYFIILPLLANLYIFWKLNKTERKKMVILAVVGGILTLILAKLGSHFYNNPRPQFKDGSVPLFGHSNDNGFPSDHTLLAAFLGYLALGYSKKIGIGVLATAVLIGWARVAAHVHHLVDIAGSFVIAVVAYNLAKYLIQRFYDVKSKSK